jgi:hypothetical protein
MALAPEVRAQTLKRLDAFMVCGAKLNVRACGSCDGVRAGSGTFEGTVTCKTKMCPFCAWVRAKRVGEFFERAFDVLDHPGHQWQQITVTFPYDPSEDITVADLRSRAIRAGRVASYLWKVELKQDGAGMYRHVEVSARGHVHLNIVYFGPMLDMTALTHQVQTSAHAEVVGSIHTQPIDWVHRPVKGTKGFRESADDPRGSKEGLKRAAEYIAKGMEFGGGTNDEEFLSDQAHVRTVDSTLVVRWDLATRGVKLASKAGVLYGLKLVETADVEPHEDIDDADKPCACCGVVGEWRTVRMRTDQYVLACHELGQKALVFGTWKPPPPD